MAFNERLSYLHSNENAHHKISMAVNPCKNLNDIFTSLETIHSEHEHLQVYLRVRPSLASEDESDERNIEIEDETHVIASAPYNSHAFKNRPHGAAKVTQRFTFTHVYDPSSTQKQIFEDTSQKLIKEFIEGQNCLLFSYGATNSGKTFTIQGSQTNPGVLPRSLDYLFQTIGHQLYKGADLKPQHFCGVVRLLPKEIQKEQEYRETLFKFALDPGSALSKSNLSLFSTISKESEVDGHCNSTYDSTKISDVSPENSLTENASQNCVYAIFLSFAEIYQENIYDLLDKHSLQKNSKKSALVLGEDRDGAIYIKGLREIRVTSIEEALQVLEAGYQSLHFASTLLNHHSSRSHCIFTIKLIRLADPEKPHYARVSMLSLCDLAGTERAGKTLNSHDRLKEASNINTSLLVLGRCIAALRHNQLMQKQNCGPKKTIPVPYRDSKVTRLFQSFFMGRGRLGMIVNVCAVSNLFDETLKVLKFSALAQKVAIVQDKSHLENFEESKRHSQFARMMRQSFNVSMNSGRISVPWANSTLSDVTFGRESHMTDVFSEEEEEEEEEEDDRMQDLLDLIKTLKEKLLQECKEKQELESRLRKELCEDFGKRLVEIEDTWRNRIQEERSRAEEYMEWRVSHAIGSDDRGPTKKRLRTENIDNEEEMVPSLHLVREQIKVEELQKEKSILEEELTALKNSLKSSNQDLKAAQGENSKLSFQLAHLTSSYDKLSKEVSQLETLKEKLENVSGERATASVSDLLEQNKALQKQLKDKEIEITEIKTMLDEAAEEFIHKEQTIVTLKDLLSTQKEKITQKSLTITELESKLSEAEHMVDTQQQLLETREQAIFDLESESQARRGENSKENCLSVLEDATSVQKLEDLLQEKESIIQQLEEECCNLAEKVSALEERDDSNSESQREIEAQNNASLAKIEAEKNASLAKIEEMKNLNKEVIEEKELLTFKVAELQFEVSSLKEVNENSQSVVDEEEYCSLKDLNQRLQKRLQNIEEVLSLKEISESTLHGDLNSMRELLDKEILDKQCLESKLEIASQLEGSLKNKISEKELEIIDLTSRQEEKLKTALEQISLLEDSKTVSEEKLKVLELKFSNSEDSEKRLNSICQEVEDKLKASTLNEKELKCSLLKTEAKVKALVEVKDSLIEQNRILDEKLVNMQSTLEETKKESERNSADLAYKDAVNEKSLEEQESKLDSLKCDLEKFKMTIDTLKSEKSDLLAKVSGLNNQVQDLVQSKTELTGILETKEEEFDSTCDKFKKENKVLLDDVKQMTLRIECLHLEKAEYFKELEHEISSKTADSDSKQEEIAKLENSLRHMEDENKKLETKLFLVESEQSTLLARLEDEDRTKAQLEEYKEMLSKSISLERSYKEEKQDLRMRLMSLEETLKEKDDRTSKLMFKIENLDKKLAQKEEECALHTSKSFILEKEVAAVRSARTEEVTQLEANITAKESEISSLQQEMKRLLQSSVLTDASESLNHRVTFDTKREPRFSEIPSSFEECLPENLPAPSQEGSFIATPSSIAQTSHSKLSKVSFKQENQDYPKPKAAEKIPDTDLKTPANSTRTRRTKKALDLPENCEPESATPGAESLRLVLEGSDIETPVVNTRTRSSRKTTQRRDLSSENDGFKAPLTVKHIVSEDESDTWEPPISSKAKTTRTTTRKTKSRRQTKIETSHVDNKENIQNNEPSEADSSVGKSRPPRGRRRPLYNADAETFDCAPNLIELPEEKKDSPHTVVRRQLRKRK